MKDEKDTLYLTPKQARVFELFNEGKSQYEIAKIIYGTTYRQGDVSRILKEISVKLGWDLMKDRMTKEKRYLKYSKSTFKRK